MVAASADCVGAVPAGLCAALVALSILTACASPAASPPTISPLPQPSVASPAAPELTGQASAALPVLPSSLVWDPAGRWLAFTSADGRAWLQARSSQQAFALEGIRAGYPAELRAAWSPDGSILLVYGTWGEPAFTGLWLVPVGASGAEMAREVLVPAGLSSPVMQNDGAINAAAWSPDGALIAYTLHAEVWIYELASGQSHQVSNISHQTLARTYSAIPFDGVTGLAWSPDGLRLALELSCDCPSPWSGVGLLDLTTFEARLLVDGGRDVNWSPDGRWVSFQNTTGEWSAGTTYDYYGLEPASGKVTNLTASNPGWDPLSPAEGTYRDAPYQTAGLVWGPRGGYLYSTLAYPSADGSVPWRGVIVRSASQEVTIQRPGTSTVWYVFPAWLADGRCAWLEADTASSDAFTFAVTRAVVGERALPLAMPDVNGAAWAPDGSALALCSAASADSDEARVVVIELPAAGQ